MPLQSSMRSSRLEQDVRDSARTALEDQIKTHANAIIELKGRINRMSLTARLPPEIFSEIFTLVAVEYYQARRWSHYGPSHAYKWITLTHVCHTWREIALSTPRLWSRIVLTRVDVATEVLARSKKAPLWLSATLTRADEPRARALDALMQESGRLKELHLTGPAQTVQSLSARWETSADLLERLTISSDFKQFDPTSLLPSKPLSSQIFSGQTPKLRHLQLHRIAFDWSSSLFCTTLKTLSIHAIYEIAPKLGDFSQLLNALEAMPLLETLQLNEAIPRLPDDVTQLPRDVQRTVTLPNLRSIELFSDAIDSANLLRHVSAPPGVRMVVNGRTERGVEDLVRVFGECLSRSAPLCTAQLAPMYSSQVYVRLWRSYVDSNHGDPLSPISAELSLDAYPHSRALQALVQHSTFLSQLHRFEVHIESHRNWDWKAIFERMPEVRVLSVTGHSELSFLAALAVVRDADAPDADESAGSLPLVHLHTLELDGVRFGCAHSDHASRFLEELLNWLILRCNYGVPILRLVLRACVNAEGEAVDRLREVVPEVEWDEQECFEDDSVVLSDGDTEGLDELFYEPLAPADLGHLYDDDDEGYDLDFFMIPFGF